MRMRIVLVICGIALAALCLSGGCSSDEDPSNIVGAADPKLAGDPVDPRLVEANTRFAMNLFGELAGADSGRNVFISPASVSIALTMTYNGADGATKAAMADVLGLSDMELAEANDANLVLLSNLAYGDEKVRLDIANSLWARQDIRFDDGFMSRNREFYGAEVASLDFADPASLGTINGWVEDHTNGKIKDILDAIPADAILYLINAIYFKGTWTYEFDPSDTRDEPFTLADGSTKSVPMMKQSGTFRYMERDGLQAVRLPYGDEGRLAMYVFLPDHGGSIDGFAGSLDTERWEGLVDVLQQMEGDVSLPRFKMEYKKELKDPLIALGMGPAFGGGFGNMFPPDEQADAFISRVIHQTFLDVNEEGTEAAAATVVEMRYTSVPQRFSFIADRPFFLAIVDDVSGTILFMGIVHDPGP